MDSQLGQGTEREFVFTERLTGLLQTVYTCLISFNPHDNLMR